MTSSLFTPIRKLLGRLRRSFGVDTFDIFARPIQPEDSSFENPEGYRLAWATPEDIDGCVEYHTELDERERRFGSLRLGFGHTAVVAFHGDTIVFSMWVNPRNLNIPGQVKRELDGRQSFIYKAFTSPDHRGKKLYKAGMRFVLCDMASRGQTELIGYAHQKKKVSRAGLNRLGFTSKGQYKVLHLPGFERVFISSELSASFPTIKPRSRALSEG